MNLTEEQVRSVETVLRLPGWRVFEDYVAIKREQSKELVTPDDLFSFLTREQQFGKVEAYRELIPDFLNNLKQEQKKYEQS